MGELELVLGYQRIGSSLEFSGSSWPVAQPESTFAVHQGLLLGLRYGLSSRSVLEAELPLLYPVLSNALLESSLHNPTPLPGDLQVVWDRSVWSLKRPQRARLALRVSGRLPTGLQTPGDVGSVLLTGTGIPELGLALRHERQLSSLLALEAEAGGTWFVSQVVPYMRNQETGGDGRLAPGPMAEASLKILAAPHSRVVIAVGGHGAYQGTYKLGATTETLWPRQGLTPIDGSSGLFVDAGGGLEVALTRHLQLELVARYAFMGRTLQELSALGLERFSPLPGLTLEAALHLRLDTHEASR